MFHSGHRILVYVFISLCTCLILMSVNYAVGNDSSERTYGLSENYLVIDCEERESSEWFTTLLKYSEVVAIAETVDLDLIGLYDPDMTYYLYASKFISEGELRYFSHEDYVEKNSVGIVLDSFDYLLRSGGLNLTAYREVEETYEMSVINVFDNSSSIANNASFSIIKNFFSIDPKLIRTVYLDSDNAHQLSSLSDELSQMGISCRSSDASRTVIDFFQLLYRSFFGKRYVTFLSISLLFVYFLFLYVLSSYTNFKNIVRINRSFGASLPGLLGQLFKSLLYPAAVVCLASALIWIYLNNIREISISLLEQVAVTMFLLISMAAVFFIKLLFSYEDSRKEMK